MTPDPLIQIKNLVYPIADPGPVLSLNLLTVNPGEQWVITGPSGCGKTTLLDIVAGSKELSRGQVNLFGTDLSELSPSRRDAFRGVRIGRIFQEFNLLEPFTAIENVCIGLQYAGIKTKKESTDRAKDLLNRAGLPHRLNSRISTLSTGERQRVAVVRALAPRPSLLIADEPTASLDPKHAHEVCDLIKTLCREEGTALLFVTHDVDLINDFDHHLDASTLLTEGGES